jgi:hypothetical protein
MENGKNCFENVSLNSNSYDELLSHIASVSRKEKVEFGGGFSEANGPAGTQARYKLVNKLGWKITDGENTSRVQNPKAEKYKPEVPNPEQANDF